MALYYLVPRFATATFDLGLRLCAMENLFCCGQSVPSRPLDNGGGGGGGGGWLGLGLGLIR